MPFKPKLPPVIFKVEGLSDGREIRPRFIENDLEPGKLIPVKQDDSPPRVMRSGNEILNEIKQREQAYWAGVLVTSGLVADPRPKPEPKPIVQNIPGMRPVGKLGEGRALYIALPSWRRW